MFVLCAKEEKYLNLYYVKHVIFTYALKQNESDPSHFKLDDALPETVRTKPTTRTNLACFTRDRVSKHNVCPQGTWETWRQLGRLVKETAAWYFIGYYVNVLADVQ